MDMSKMTRQEIEVLLRLLAEWERQELTLLMLQRRLAKQEGQLHDQPGTRFESLLPAIHSGNAPQALAAITVIIKDLLHHVLPCRWHDAARRIAHERNKADSNSGGYGIVDLVTRQSAAIAREYRGSSPPFKFKICATGPVLVFALKVRGKCGEWSRRVPGHWADVASPTRP
jgi:hypothetical protein